MEKENFLISIIVPVFNAEKHIHNTFNSIKNQTIGFENLELIFVDDCSTDNSKNIIKSYSESYSNVKSIFLDVNTGFGGEPRNVGIINASAEYIMFLDSDDVFYDYACELLYNEIINEDLDLVSGNYVVSVNGNKEKNVWNQLNLMDNKLYVKNVKENNEILIIPPAIMSKIYKKSIIIDNNIKFPMGVPGEDLVFSSNYFINSNNFLFLDIPIFEYIIRQDENNKSVTYERGKQYLMGLMESYIDLFYMIITYDKTIVNIVLSRLNYWMIQFISSELSILDRIELLKFSEVIFSEFKKFGSLYPLPDYELIFNLVYKKRFYEASKVAELLNIKQKDDDNVTNDMIENEINQYRVYLKDFSTRSEIDSAIADFNEKLANFNLDLFYLNKFLKQCNNDEISKAIDLINNFELFDYEFYVTEYNYELNLNPLLHYICWGYKEGKNPNKQFDGVFYKNFYESVYNSNLNPFIYFILYGMEKGELKINNKFNLVHNFIDKTVIKNKLLNFNDLGITKNKRNRKLVVSLTSFPERIYDVQFSIYSLLNQSLKPDKIVLWLAENQFPNKEEDLPNDLLNLKKNGLTIEWCEDLKSYKKLIPSLKKYSEDIIITADDDLFYPKNWLETLYEDYKKYPNCIISHRVRKILFEDYNSLSSYNKWGLSQNEEFPSYLNFPTNGAGSLFPPNSLHEDITKTEIFRSLCPHGDDIWIWAMAVLNNTKIKGVKENFVDLIYVNYARELQILNETTLYSTNYFNNDKQIKNVMERYPKILDKLKYGC